MRTWGPSSGTHGRFCSLLPSVSHGVGRGDQAAGRRAIKSLVVQVSRAGNCTGVDSGQRAGLATGPREVKGSWMHWGFDLTWPGGPAGSRSQLSSGDTGF